jgi:hypothetical protein
MQTSPFLKTVIGKARPYPAGDICYSNLFCKPDFHRTIGRERPERAPIKPRLPVGVEGGYRYDLGVGGEVMSSQATSRHWWSFVIGILALMVAGQAIHWFITPGSITASSARWWAVMVQAVLGTVVAVWFFLRALKLRREN